MVEGGREGGGKTCVTEGEGGGEEAEGDKGGRGGDGRVERRER